MKIIEESFNKINKLISDEPPETGGILGSNDDNCITDIILDKPCNTYSRFCCYEPNIPYLNKCIADWANERIHFKGIFHTHFAGVRSLSDADVKYIHVIMEKMPDQIKFLYFPVFVLPDRELVCYKAERKDGVIYMCREEVIFK